MAGGFDGDVVTLPGINPDCHDGITTMVNTLLSESLAKSTKTNYTSKMNLSEPDTFCLQVVAWRFLFLFLFSSLFLYMGGSGLFLDPPVSLPGAGRCAEKFVVSFPDFRLGAPLQSTAARALSPLVKS